jgi:D-amino-acid dehydrogenase
VRQNGWIRCLRTEGSLREKIAEARRLDQYGIDYAVLTGAQLRVLEPHVSEKIIRAIHFRGSPTSSDPGALTKAYVDLFVRKGGLFLKGDARRLAQDTSGWSIPAEDGPITAREAVVALGPWWTTSFVRSATAFLWRSSAVINGVHGNARLGHPLHDADGGYLLVR